MNSTKSLVLVVGSLVAALVIGACGGSSTSYGGGAPACSVATATATTSVTIQASAFTPPCIKVAAGATVTFTNNDAMQHTVTADDGSYNALLSLSGATQTFQHAYAAAGTSNYHCTFHSLMKGTVIVQ
jgi:plastocyanin